MPVFGQRSNTELSGCHRDMQLIHRTAIKSIPVDYTVIEGKRSDEKQLEYFLAGKSRIDPRNPELKKKGKHLREPSEATDIMIAESHNGEKLSWNPIHFSFVAGYLIRVSQELYEKGETEYLLRWGGDWDMDGIICLDQTLDDMPHFELYKPK